MRKAGAQRQDRDGEQVGTHAIRMPRDRHFDIWTFRHFSIAWFDPPVRLTRAIWALLTLFLVVALAITWGMTRPDEAEAAWVGAVAVLAGDGRDGSRDGPADEARFSEPFGIAATEDAVFVSDAGGSHRIRRIGADGSVSTLAGDSRGFADGRGRAARFSTPSGIAVAPDLSLIHI